MNDPRTTVPDWPAGLRNPGRLDFVALTLNATATTGFTLEHPWYELHGQFANLLRTRCPPAHDLVAGPASVPGLTRPVVLSPARGLAWSDSARKARRPAAWPGVQIEPADEVSANLILVGKAMVFAAACAQALLELCDARFGSARKALSPASIVCEGLSERRVIWTAGRGWNLLGLLPVAAGDVLCTPLPGTRTKLRWVSPLRLQEGNAMLREGPSPRHLVIALLRRMSMLAGQDDEIVSVDKTLRHRLIEQAEALRLTRSNCRWERMLRPASDTRPDPLDLGGVVGDQFIEGELGMLSGFLALGQWLHVGKNTAWGMGRYLIEPLPEQGALEGGR